MSVNTSDRIEGTIETVLRRAREAQVKVSQLQKQAEELLKTNEITAREKLHQVFDGGLTLLGKGIINARKATESFVAETHRKAKKLEKVVNEQEFADANVSEVIPAELKPTHKMTRAKTFHGKAEGKKIKNQTRKNKIHTSTARAH